MRTIRHYIDKRAEQDPDRIYLIAPEAGLSLTYGQLKKDSEALGKHLMKLGLKKGDKVSFMMGNGYQTTRIFLGAMYSGFVMAPISLTAQPSQLEYVLAHSDTKLIFFTADQMARLESAIKMVKRPIDVVLVENDRETIFPDNENLASFTLPEVTEDDTALLLYTSGTTGLPKGVPLSHKNIISGGTYTARAHELTPEDRALCSLVLYHINGAVVTAVAPLVSGGSVVMPHRFRVSNFWELISDLDCTWFSVVPTIISYLYHGTDNKERDLNTGKIRFGRSASSPLPTSLQKAFEEKFKIPIVETMGLTETAAPILSNPMVLSGRKYGSVGVPVGNDVKIIDGEGNEVPRGTPGEIMVRGDNVMKGYYKAPKITAMVLEPDGWLHTGDLGYMDDYGFVFVTGRIKEIIIKGGENIAPREIDEALYAHPVVQDAAAVGIPDEHYGEEIMCCVVLKPGSTVTEEELLFYCREKLGEFKTPKEIQLVDDLPKGPSGKIQRLKLRKMVIRENRPGRVGGKKSF